MTCFGFGHLFHAVAFVTLVFNYSLSLKQTSKKPQTQETQQNIF